MRVAVVQLAYGDDEPVGERVARVSELVRRQAGHDLVVLPELWAPGGFAYRQWEERAETVDGPVAQALAEAARAAGVTLHGGSIVERADPVEPGGPGRWNTSLVFSAGGELVATYRKVHRFGFGEGEPRLMEAGSELVVVDVPVAGGDPVRVGLSTCYDLRFPELYRGLVDDGAEMFVVPAAWPAARVSHWTLLGQARAVEDQCVVVQCNTAGTHARHEMGGRSQVVAPDGRVLGAAGPGEEVLSIEVDVSEVARLRAAFPVLSDRRLR
ncbi:MAG TPA: nitrilase-related carbon-nitrogen hydrolase [Intrasporangium sp.]|uniref:nitrilase-related carbon-nitrogen hydrolase n=1 Tax=Intrasporangium sp. TaxID=1925024 RepID=UPI002D7821A2|nr:nitrilase-related carbon-nitrogen hydrolase [Intrasporangium sp.]HET7398303.1 nitrilase-related carbon-nitrogen hydrolase [Intrasporangium sp.]